MGDKNFNIKYFRNGFLLGCSSALVILGVELLGRYIHLDILEPGYTPIHTGLNALIIVLSTIIISLVLRYLMLHEINRYSIDLSRIIMSILLVIISISTFMFFSQNISNWNLYGGSIMGILFLVFGEEISKFLHAYTHSHIGNTLIFSLFVALGFGFIENIKYVSQYPEITVYIGRSLVSLLLHMISSFTVFVFFQKGKNLLSQNSTLFKGLILSIIIHTIFNITLDQGWVSLAFLYCCLGYMFIGNQLNKKKTL